jgi:hypothetical protein
MALGWATLRHVGRARSSHPLDVISTSRNVLAAAIQESRNSRFLGHSPEMNLKA